MFFNRLTVRGVFRTQSNIYDGAFLWKIFNRFFSSKYLCISNGSNENHHFFRRRVVESKASSVFYCRPFSISSNFALQQKSNIPGKIENEKILKFFAWKCLYLLPEDKICVLWRKYLKQLISNLNQYDVEKLKSLI